ncbi:MAG: PilN domain-containing protein [Zoogloeaceae bacterium]|jgi:type IV pilus assembly protein PilN|nr:PilN domain-containing protein [Zoogloeaceae bacterium]
MIRINLLPHREEKRKERRKQFYAISVMMFILGAVIWLSVHAVNARHIESQDARNRYIEGEIAKLDDVIVEIKDLRTQIDRLLARKQVIETLQSNRAETVHLFNELSTRLPMGVYLTTVTQSDNKITLKGYAQSNARVSQLMVNLNESPLFTGNTEFIGSVAEMLNNRRAYSFEINVYIKHSSAPADEAENAAPGRKG